MAMNFDLHIHSIYSKDAILKPESIVRIAKKKGLSGIAVTDHDTIKGALKTKSVAFDNFMVIVGAEVQTDKGEIIGLFLNDEIKPREFTEVIDEIKDQDGITVLPHPYKNRQCDPKDLLEMIDLVEVLNARTSKELNYRAQILAKNFGLPIIAGSDAHTPFEIGRVQTIIQGREVIFDDIKDYLLKGKAVITGKESPHYIRLLSAGIGRFRRDGAIGLMKSGMNKVLNPRK